MSNKTIFYTSVDPEGNICIKAPTTFLKKVNKILLMQFEKEGEDENGVPVLDLKLSIFQEVKNDKT